MTFSGIFHLVSSFFSDLYHSGTLSFIVWVPLFIVAVCVNFYPLFRDH